MAIFLLFHLDVENWTIDQVVNWASGVTGFGIVSLVLKDQRVDGKKLLTLTEDQLTQSPYKLPYASAASGVPSGKVKIRARVSLSFNFSKLPSQAANHKNSNSVLVNIVCGVVIQ